MSCSDRLKVWYVLVLVGYLAVVARLFYWQVLAGNKLETLAAAQHQNSFVLPANRGEILAAEGFPLVTNQPAYLLYAYKPDIEVETDRVVSQLVPLIQPTPDPASATNAAKLIEESEGTKVRLTTSLSKTTTWVALAKDLDQGQKEAVEKLGIKGLGFESYQLREYPEASTGAQLVGFVGSDGTGKAKGYFGLEGYYNLELAGRPGLVRQERDAFGRPILIGDYAQYKNRDGRTLKTFIDRGIQLMVEEKLEWGVSNYGAKAGEVVVMDPNTGAILAMAAWPSYEPVSYKQYPQEFYPIPSISEHYEPGSTFKALVMAAVMNEGLITPDSTCDTACAGPVSIGKYSIHTALDEYHPGQTMTEVLKRSDNTGMVYVAFTLGKDKFREYLTRYNFGNPTGIDLEAESVPKLRDNWGDIDLATGSFGQGLAVTSVQMLAAYSSLANGGKVVKPRVVDQVITTDEIISTKVEVLAQPISPKTSEMITGMLVASGAKPSAGRILPKGYVIAGKSGTAQVPIAGHYDKEKTIASFIGFAPADDPKFLMLVKLREPSASPWAEDTAAPLWYYLAKELFIHLNIPPKL